MRFGRRKITYYDTEAGFEAEKFAARLLLLLMNEMRASGRRQVVFLCIGTDRSTGDSLGRSLVHGWRRRRSAMWW